MPTTIDINVASQIEKRILESEAPNDAYHYWDLQESGWIRVLVIFPAIDRDDRISCSLLHQPLSEDTRYEALSYTWGTDTANLPILIDGRVFRVRINLYLALRDLRQARTQRVVWADAVCINQSDNVEKGRQVAQMGRVYSLAHEVVVWLREGVDHTDLGLATVTKFISDCVRRRGGSSPDHEAHKAAMAILLALPDVEERVSGICGIFLNRWWQRIWTVQEICLARKASIVCGRANMPWSFLELYANITSTPEVYRVWDSWQPSSEFGRSAKEMHLAQVSVVLSILEVKKGWNTGGLSLSSLCMATMARAATDPRDKIFALLVLRVEGNMLEACYTLPVRHCFTAAFKAMVREDGDLRCFAFFLENPRTRDRSLPTWVPDFSIGVERLDELDMDQLSGGATQTIGRIYDAASSDRPPSLSFAADDKILKVQGISVDTIEETGPTFPRAQKYDESEASHGLFTDVMTHSWTMASRILADNQYFTGESLKDAFWITMVTDLKVPGYHPGFAFTGPGKERRLDRPLDKMIPPSTREGEAQLVRRLAECSSGPADLMTSRGRKLVSTMKGPYLGLGPSGTRKGDVVCVLVGGEVPFVLRPLPNGKLYEMVGECYLHGFMDGEAMRMVGRGLFYQDFELV